MLSTIKLSMQLALNFVYGVHKLRTVVTWELRPILVLVQGPDRTAAGESMALILLQVHSFLNLLILSDESFTSRQSPHSPHICPQALH